MTPSFSHSEISEILEAYRNGNPGSDKLPDYDSMTEETADAVIRLLDFAHHLNLPVLNCVRDKTDYNATRPFRHGKTC